VCVCAHVMAHLDNTPLVRVASRENAVALNEEQLEVLLRVRDETVKLMTDVIDRGARLGVFNVIDTHLTVMAVGAMGIRAAEWWTPDSPHSKEDVADTYAEFAVRLLSEPKVGG